MPDYSDSRIIFDVASITGSKTRLRAVQPVTCRYSTGPAFRTFAGCITYLTT